MDSSIQGKCPSFVCKKDGVRIQITRHTINDIKRGLIIYQCVHCRSQVGGHFDRFVSTIYKCYKTEIIRINGKLMIKSNVS